MTNPILSIIIPTLNEEYFIGPLLEEVISQDNQYEIIVSDSGSTDKTEEIVKNIQARHPNHNIIFSKLNKRGVSLARNNGANLATGTYLVYLDADTRIPKNFLKNALEEIKLRNLDAAGCYLIPSSKLVIDKIMFSIHRYFILNPLQYTKRPGSAGAGIIIKRKFHDLVNGFNENMKTCEDIDYIKKISKIGKFRMLKTTSIYFNTRRFDEEGRARVWFKYTVWGSCYLLNLKSAKFEYEFGKFNTNTPIKKKIRLSREKRNSIAV